MTLLSQLPLPELDHAWCCNDADGGWSCSYSRHAGKSVYSYTQPAAFMMNLRPSAAGIGCSSRPDVHRGHRLLLSSFNL